MKVQLDDKSKAEFIEHIAKDSITCWFDGDEFVMPSGQGRTARGIVLGKLLVWQHRQTEVDELQKRVDAAFRVLSQLNDLDDEAHKRWKREACMFSQGESNAYEHSVRLLEQALKGDQ